MKLNHDIRKIVVVRRGGHQDMVALHFILPDPSWGGDDTTSFAAHLPPGQGLGYVAVNFPGIPVEFIDGDTGKVVYY